MYITFFFYFSIHLILKCLSNLDLFIKVCDTESHINFSEFLEYPFHATTFSTQLYSILIVLFFDHESNLFKFPGNGYNGLYFCPS